SGESSSCSVPRRCGAGRARHEAERPTLVAEPSPTEGSLCNSFEPSSPPYQGPGSDQQADQGPDRQDQQVTPVGREGAGGDPGPHEIGGGLDGQEIGRAHV